MNRRNPYLLAVCTIQCNVVKASASFPSSIISISVKVKVSMSQELNGIPKPKGSDPK
jgi:hypothetical protein